ncbi:MAG: hypothetical protein LUF87_05275 [Alistipes sp.]|nr:hypothetical protein [Alistipes sp.]
MIALSATAVYGGDTGVLNPGSAGIKGNVKHYIELTAHSTVTAKVIPQTPCYFTTGYRIAIDEPFMAGLTTLDSTGNMIRQEWYILKTVIDTTFRGSVEEVAYMVKAMEGHPVPELFNFYADPGDSIPYIIIRIGEYHKPTEYLSITYLPEDNRYELTNRAFELDEIYRDVYEFSDQKLMSTSRFIGTERHWTTNYKYRPDGTLHSTEIIERDGRPSTRTDFSRDGKIRRMTVYENVDNGNSRFSYKYSYRNYGSGFIYTMSRARGRHPYYSRSVIWVENGRTVRQKTVTTTPLPDHKKAFAEAIESEIAIGYNTRGDYISVTDLRTGAVNSSVIYDYDEIGNWTSCTTMSAHGAQTSLRIYDYRE